MSRDSSETPPPDVRDALAEDGSASPGSENDIPVDELWSLLGVAKTPAAALPDPSDTWEEVHRHIQSDESSTSPDSSDKARSQRPPRRGSPRRAGRRAAAAVLSLLVVALGAWLWYRPVVVSAPPGSAVTHSLPDGSVVELNGGSQITYQRSLSAISFLEAEQRRVRLHGEAYFDVEAGERPFSVRTPSARVRVVGTEFVVRTAGDRHTYVALAEGTVDVEGREGSEDAVRLRPGEAVQVNANGSVTPPADTSIERVTAWRQGGFAVTAQPLPSIAQALEQQFGQSVRLSSSIPERVTSSPLTLYYSNDVGIETILHDISMARDLAYRPAPGNGYVLTRSSSSTQPSSGSPSQP